MRDFFRRWVFYWIWCAIFGTNLGLFIGGLFINNNLVLVLCNYFVFVLSANIAEECRIDAIARARGYLV